jgi:hypothetical protein
MGLEPIQISELLQSVLNLLDVFSFLGVRYVRVVGSEQPAELVGSEAAQVRKRPSTSALIFLDRIKTRA